MDVDKTADRLNNLKDWKLDRRVKERLKDSGFDGLLRLTNFPVKHDKLLLSALVESYDIDNRCFVFNNHKLVFGLEDILYITGLPIDGKPVTGIDLKSQHLSKKYLGSCNLKYRKSGSTSFEWLKCKFETVPENIDINSPDIEPYVRAFLMYLIGSIVVPDRPGASVPLMYLSLLEKLEGIKDYAWGAAMLAHLHVSLEKFKQDYLLGKRNILMGHSYSLMVFAMERIPKLVSAVCLSRNDYLPTSFPLLEGWTKLLHDTAGNVEKKTTKHHYLQILGELQENNIVWQPYQRLPSDFLPQYCAGQEKIGMSRTILLCFQKAVYHRPDLSPKQFGIQNVNTSKLRSIVELKCKRRTGNKEVDWNEHSTYGLYKEEWKNRNSCIIEEHDVSSQGPNDSDSLSAKRKRVDVVGHDNNVHIDITRGNNATNPESQFGPYTESRVVTLVHTEPVAAHFPSFEINTVSSQGPNDSDSRVVTLVHTEPVAAHFPYFTLHTVSSQSPNDSDSLSPKRKRVDPVGHENTVQIDITRENNATNPESQFEPYIESGQVKLVHTAPVAAPFPSFEIYDLSSEDEEDDTVGEDGTLNDLLSAPNYSCLGVSSSQLSPPLAMSHDLNSSGHLRLCENRIINQNSSINDPSTSIGVSLTQSSPPQGPPQVCSIKKECDDAINVLDELDDLLQQCDPSTSYAQPSTLHDEVNSAKETIKTILCQGLDALKDSEVLNSFLASSEVLLSDAVLSSDLKTILNQLQNDASTFLKVKDIPTATEVSYLKKLLELEVKVPAVEEHLRRANYKVACIRAKLDAVCEKREKMKKAATSFKNKIQDAKQKVANVELVRKCYSSWSGLGHQLSSNL